jgi:hypothetical protein
MPDSFENDLKIALKSLGEGDGALGIVRVGGEMKSYTVMFNGVTEDTIEQLFCDIGKQVKISLGMNRPRK